MITADSGGLGERRVVLLIAKAVSYLVYAYLIVVEIILLLGFVLLLFGANPSVGFTEWVYRNLDRVMSPFRGIFSLDRTRRHGQRCARGLRDLGRVRNDRLRDRGTGLRRDHPVVVTSLAPGRGRRSRARTARRIPSTRRRGRCPTGCDAGPSCAGGVHRCTGCPERRCRGPVGSACRGRSSVTGSDRDVPRGPGVAVIGTLRPVGLSRRGGRRTPG